MLTSDQSIIDNLSPLNPGSRFASDSNVIARQYTLLQSSNAIFRIYGAWAGHFAAKQLVGIRGSHVATNAWLIIRDCCLLES
jgi:hypothetical protein